MSEGAWGGLLINASVYIRLVSCSGARLILVIKIALFCFLGRRACCFRAFVRLRMCV